MPNTSEDVIFRRGPSASIPQEKVPGTILIETDTGNMYVDDTESSRIQIKDSTKMDKWGDIQDLGGIGAPLIIKPQDQRDLSTPTTSFGISLTGYPNDGLYLTSTGHHIFFESYELSVSNSGVSFVSNGEVPIHLTLSNSGTSLNNSLSIDGNLHCKGDIYLKQSDTEPSICFTEVSSGILGLIGSSGGVVIRGVATPTQSDDAANKAYVDTGLADKQDKWATVSGGSTINSLTNSKDNLQINADGYISLYSPLVRIGAGDPQILTISSSSATVSGNLKMNRGKQIQFTDEAGNYSTFMSTSGTDTSTIWTISTPGTIRFNPSGLSISISTNGIDMGSSGTRKITNLIAPTAATDAANKQYVDGLYQNLESEIVTTAAQYLPLKGGTMTGDLTLKSSYLNFEGSDGVSSAYISYDTSDGVTIRASSNGASLRIVSRNEDNSNNRFVQFYNGTTATPLRVTGISTPIYSNDAANKQYVDQSVASAGGGDFMSNGSVPMTGNLQMGQGTSIHFLNSSGSEGSFIESSGSSANSLFIVAGNSLFLRTGDTTGSGLLISTVSGSTTVSLNSVDFFNAAGASITNAVIDDGSLS